MNTLELWRALHNPPEDRVIYQQMARLNRRYKIEIPDLVELMLPIAMLVIAPLLWIVPVIAGTVTGVYYTDAIARKLNAEQRRGTRDLLSLTPAGRAGTHRALVIVTLRQGRFFEVLRVSRGVTILLMTAILVIVGLAIFLQMVVQGSDYAQLLPELALMGSTALVFVVIDADQRQSVALAVALGMFVSYIATDSSRLLAIVAFLTFKIAVFTITFGVGVWLPTLLSAEVIAVYRGLAQWSVQALLLISLHESAIYGLTRVHTHLLGETVI